MEHSGVGRCVAFNIENTMDYDGVRLFLTDGFNILFIYGYVNIENILRDL